MRQHHGNELPSFSQEEIEYVKGSIDFIGINHYSILYAKDCIHSAFNLGGDHAITGFVHTTGLRDGVLIGEQIGLDICFVVPRGMEKIVNYIKGRYNNMPVYVTEIGYCPPSQQSEQVQTLLHDVKRIKFHKTYLAALARALGMVLMSEDILYGASWTTSNGKKVTQKHLDFIMLIVKHLSELLSFLLNGTKISTPITALPTTGMVQRRVQHWRFVQKGKML